MRMYDLDFMQAFMHMCEDGWQQNWHERNGGNLTYRMTDEEVRQFQCLTHAAPGPWTAMGVSVPGVAGQWYVVTGSGKYFRHIMHNPKDNIAIIEIDDKGDRYLYAVFEQG